MSDTQTGKGMTALRWPDREGLERIRRAVGLGCVVLAAVVLALVVREVTAVPPPGPVPPPTDSTRFGMTLPERQEIFRKFLKNEARWRRQCKRRFPKHEWSRFDHHGHLVRDHAHHLANVYGVHESIIYLIYDEGVHEHWSNRKGRTIPPTIVPLRPRLE